MSSAPLIIAHRGARNLAPENTLAAFRKAIELGADGVELDLHLTSDGIPVVIHDDDLSVLLGHPGSVSTTPYAALSTLDAGSHFGPVWKGEKIPTLEEALEVFNRPNLHVMLEVKGQRGRERAAATAIGEIVTGRAWTAQVTIASFSWRILREFHRRFPGLALGFVRDIRTPLAFVSTVLATKFLSLDFHSFSLHHGIRRYAEFSTRRRIPFYVWTVNRPEDIAICLSLGARGMITDDVSAAQAAVKESYGRRI